MLQVLESGIPHTSMYTGIRLNDLQVRRSHKAIGGSSISAFNGLYPTIYAFEICGYGQG